MKKNAKNFLKSASIKKKAILIVFFAWALGLGLGVASEFGELIDFSISRGFDFYVRDKLGKSPELDKRIKILVVDDKTIQKLRSPSLSFKQWAELLRALDNLNPKMIFVDKVFSIPESLQDEEKNFRELVKTLKSVRTPIVAGSFFNDREIQGSQAKLDTKLFADFSIGKWVPRSTGKGQRKQADIDKLNIASGSDTGTYVYGPYGELAGAFSHIGHILYDGNGRMPPVFRINRESLIPNIALYAAKERYFVDGHLKLDGKIVPVLQNGNIQINFTRPAAYRKQMKSLGYYLEKIERGQPLQGIDAGDFVFIVPLYFTGNTDFNETPYWGPMPGAFAHISVLNSVLTGKWLRPINFKYVIVAITCLAGTLLGAVLSPLFMVICMFGFSFSWMGLEAYIFSYHGIMNYWVTGLIGFLGPAFTAFILRMRLSEKKAQFLRNAFDGNLPSRELRTIIKDPQKIDFEARERIVTIMFIDVVGYSLFAENQAPRIAFDQLKMLIAKLTREVHESGGIVNKTLGDGLLCIFGYSFAEDVSRSDHAEQAVATAIRIQEKNLAQNLKAAEKGEAVYPLRIGINTSSVYIGDLGSGEHIDYTVIGNGVNFAKRLESACSMHSVMFSSTTWDLIGDIALNPRGVQKHPLTIKHHTDFIEAYEYDPFYAYPDVRAQAIESYKNCANLARAEQRWSVWAPDMIVLECNEGGGQASLLNYSVGGLSIKLKTMVPNESILKLRIDSREGTLGAQLAAIGLTDLEGTVRWSYSEADGYVHGVVLEKVTEEEAEKMVQIIKTFDLSMRTSRFTSKMSRVA